MKLTLEKLQNIVKRLDKVGIVELDPSKKYIILTKSMQASKLDRLTAYLNKLSIGFVLVSDTDLYDELTVLELKEDK